MTDLIVPSRDTVVWRARWRIEKRLGEWGPEALGLDPVGADRALGAYTRETGHAAVLDRAGNLLMYGGVSCLWQALIGNGTSTAGQALTYFSNTNAAIGVGDSSTAASATQTDMQAATNKLRKGMDATYPAHTDGVTSGAASIVFRSTFGTSDANWAWNEWGVFNSATAGTGRMLNRKAEALGTKTSAATWTFTVTLSIA